MASQLTPFLLENLGVRGAIVEFDDGIDAMFGARPYPADVRKLLAHAVAAMPLLQANTGFEGRMSLQFRGEGAVKLLVAQLEGQGQVRGMAKCDDDAHGDLQTLLKGGMLGLLLEPAHSDQNYQAIVGIEGNNLAQALEHYYARSEQIPTVMRLAAAHGRIHGMVLQRLPLGEKNSSENNWEHARALFATLGEAELAEHGAMTLLHRLFHAEDLRVFDAQALALSCHCSRQSIGIMLLSLGDDELEDHLKTHGRFDVTCEFCGAQYPFSADDIATLQLHARTQPSNTTRH